MKKQICALCVAMFSTFSVASDGALPQTGTPAVLPIAERAEVVNKLLVDRLDNLLPQLMAESNLDMWLIVLREYQEDRLFYTLVPQPTMAARRTTMLVFTRNGDTVERFSVSRYPIGELYPTKWQGGTKEEQWQRLAQLVRERNPQRIGINVSKDWPLADGLSAGLHQQLVKSLGDDASKLVSAESLVVRWFETRTQLELAVYPQIVGIARSVIAEAFSNSMITPGVTTTDELGSKMRQAFADLDIDVWFQPYVTVQRKGDENAKDAPFFGRSNRTIMPGDVIHTDVGICYLTLCTDTQEMGYVARLGEHNLPEVFGEVMAKANQWQDLLTSEFKQGRTGNEILAATQKRAKKNGLVSSTYTHPLGFVGHAAGPTIGMWDNQGSTPVQGDWPLYKNTAYAIEGNVKVPLSIWGNQLIQVMVEQSAVYDGQTVHYLAGRQTEFHFIQ